jgi:quercetin dioxygenase-like cupin family protein
MRRVESGSAKRVTSVAAGLLLAVAICTGRLPADPRVALAQQPPSTSGVEATTLATRRLDEVPPGRRWVLRHGHPLNEDAHAHAGGFIYAARGASYLVVEDSHGFQMQEGEAAWAPETIGHLHATELRTSNNGRSPDAASTEIWTILLEGDSDARKPGASATSPLLQGLALGAHEARLAAMTFQPGASTTLRRRTGPELAYALDGTWELEYNGVPLAVGAGQGYLADPDVPHRLRNVGNEPAHLLSAQFVPDGKPAEEPVPESGP